MAPPDIPAIRPMFDDGTGDEESPSACPFCAVVDRDFAFLLLRGRFDGLVIHRVRVRLRLGYPAEADGR